MYVRHFVMSAMLAIVAFISQGQIAETIQQGTMSITRQQNTWFPYKSILETRLPSWVVCAELCSRMKVCKSFNFDSENRTCQILDQVPLECPLQFETGNTFLSRSDIPETLAGNCHMNNCEQNEICIEQSNGHMCTPLIGPTDLNFDFDNDNTSSWSQKLSPCSANSSNDSSTQQSETPTTVTGPLYVFTDLNCDFECGHICLWRQTSSTCSTSSCDDFDWTIGWGETSSRDTGPPFDHTKGNIDGMYIYIECSGPSSNEFAELVTDLLPGNHSRCLNLWYFMYGRNINQLVVGITTHDDIFQPVKTIVGDQGYQWNELYVNISSSTNFVVGIRAYRGTGFREDISIDDIVVLDGTC